MCEEITKERGSGRMSGTEDLTGGQSSHFPEGSGNSLEQPGWKIPEAKPFASAHL